MSLSKRALLTTGAGVVIGLSTVAVAQTPPPGAKGNKKSYEVGTFGEDEAYHIGPKGERLHKSHVKLTAAQHEAAMKKGAREIRPGAVIYKHGGKLYLHEDSANEKASQNFQNQFDIDY
jgi:hypothetical protein